MANAIFKDLKTIVQLVKPRSGSNHAERLENFYYNQAENYDDFRNKLLPGRELLMSHLQDKDFSTWADFGAGTGINMDFMGYERVKALDKVFLVDLSSSLLKKAKEKIDEQELENVEVIQNDACTFAPDVSLDLITFSYSLTMVPHWYKAINQAIKLLKPGGLIAVVDFYVSEKYPIEGLQRHSAWTRNFWPLWFSWDNVQLSRDHLPYLMEKFETLEVVEGKKWQPYAPFGSIPYYAFVGRK